MGLGRGGGGGGEQAGHEPFSLPVFSSLSSAYLLLFPSCCCSCSPRQWHQPYVVLGLAPGSATRWCGCVACTQVLPESLTGVIRPGCVMLGLEMRFSTMEEMRAGWMSLLSHGNWSNTLLDSDLSKIDMSIKGSLYKVSSPVRDGPAGATQPSGAPSLL